MSRSTKKQIIWNLICAALMLCMLVLQFMPFWHFEDQAVSINRYVWFPTEHSDLEAFLASCIDGFKVNHIVIVPALQLLSAAVGIVVCVLKRGSRAACLLPLLCGGLGAYGYLTMPALQLGKGWALHLVVSILMAVAGLVPFIAALKSRISEGRR